MLYNVPIHFTVSGKIALDAAQKIKARLKGHDLGFKFKVQEAQAQNPGKIKVSDLLREFLTREIDSNDDDSSGLLTDLNYCLDSARDQENGASAKIVKELERLVAKVGGTTPAASLLNRPQGQPS
jgi:hypothetical protein